MVRSGNFRLVLFYQLTSLPYLLTGILWVLFLSGGALAAQAFQLAFPAGCNIRNGLYSSINYVDLVSF
jgi:hypothetical protein